MEKNITTSYKLNKSKNNTVPEVLKINIKLAVSQDNISYQN